MSRHVWNRVKSQPGFYVKLYRFLLTILVGSLFFNLIFGCVVFYLLLNQPERDFYATSGVKSPIKLNPMLLPNQSSQWLLPPDPQTKTEIKLIPQ